jgi:hypothetical protein
LIPFFTALTEEINEVDEDDDEEDDDEEVVATAEALGSGRSSAPPHNLADSLSSKLILLLSSSSYSLLNRSTRSGLSVPIVPCPGRCIRLVGVGPGEGAGRSSGNEVHNAWSLADLI